MCGWGFGLKGVGLGGQLSYLLVLLVCCKFFIVYMGIYIDGIEKQGWLCRFKSRYRFFFPFNRFSNLWLMRTASSTYLTRCFSVGYNVLIFEYGTLK